MVEEKGRTNSQSNHSGPGDDPSAEEGQEHSLTGPTAKLPMPRFVEQTTLELSSRGGGITTPAAAGRRVTLTQEQLLAMTATTTGVANKDDDGDESTSTSMVEEDERLKASAAATTRSVKDRTMAVPHEEEEVATQTESKGQLSSLERLGGTELSGLGAHRVTNDDPEDLKRQSSPTPTPTPPLEVLGQLPLEATVITHEELETRIRQQVLSEAVVAQVVGVVDNSNQGSLAHTTAKTEESGKEAEAAKTPPRQPPKWKWIIVSLTIGLISIGIAIALGLTLSREDDDDNADGVDDSLSPATQSEQRAPEWWTEISPEIITEGSPQRLAFEWMIRNNKVDEESRFQNPAFAHTYALATFYYATGGTNWKRKDNWMNPNVPVCDWYPGDMCDSNIITPTDPPQTSADINGTIRKRRMEEGGSGSGRGGARKPKFSRLALPNNGLVGELPHETSLLTGMDEMDLSFNELTGSLRGVGSLMRDGLQKVRLEGNPLAGKVPSKVCKPFTDIALPLGGEFAMDCLDPEIDCPCCTICCLNGSSCQTTGFTGV